ncbi:MAG: aminopeptidase P N-terminal domain-containing protein [Pseudomonadota bacterium]|nr:aminopeptidase P N-terminal domain-containing protein [Pseudomonadota bacterium]
MELDQTQSLLKFAQQQRQQLFEQLPENSAVLVSSGHEQIRNRDVEFPFRADSDFSYLTGFYEPDSVLCLIKQASSKSTVFVRPKDLEQETWQGRRLGVEMAPKMLSVDQAYPVDELDEVMGEVLEDIENIYFSFSQMSLWMESVESWLGALKAKVRKGVSAPTKLCDLDEIMHENRVIKSSQEIEWMRHAAQVTVQGHLAAMRSVVPGKYEFQVQAELEGKFKQLGSQRVAFSTISASGDNACILHYTENSDLIGDHHLLLVDAGAEMHGYAGDITTTFPASGKFTEEQAQLYSLVLKAQQAAINVIKPGVSYHAPHQEVLKTLTTGLVALGILNGDVDTLIKEEACKSFFMHGTGHWLGRDVHDVGSYKVAGQWRDLQPGMVLTVEPGLYIAPEAKGVDERWMGIGIRIEDDVLVTESGHEVLTQGLPRTVDEIESWMAENNRYLTQA